MRNPDVMSTPEREQFFGEAAVTVKFYKSNMVNVEQLTREQAEALRQSLTAFLDGAPEPEWEYGYELIEPDDRNVFEREGDFISAAFAYRAAKKRIDEEHQVDLPRLQYLIVRRRKAGPWLPVEGENP